MKTRAVKMEPGMTELCPWGAASGGLWSSTCSELVLLDQDAEEFIRLTPRMVMPLLQAPLPVSHLLPGVVFPVPIRNFPCTTFCLLSCVLGGGEGTLLWIPNVHRHME